MINKYDKLAAYCQQIIKDKNIEEKYYPEFGQIPDKYINYEFINKYGILFIIIAYDDYELTKMLIFNKNIDLNVLLYRPSICIYTYNVLDSLLQCNFINIKLIKYMYKRTNIISRKILSYYIDVQLENSDIKIIKYLIKKGADIHFGNCLREIKDWNWHISNVNYNLKHMLNIFLNNGFNLYRIYFGETNISDLKIYKKINNYSLFKKLYYVSKRHYKNLIKYYFIINSNKYKVGFIFGSPK
jgi:hypothetical protein